MNNRKQNKTFFVFCLYSSLSFHTWVNTVCPWKRMLVLCVNFQCNCGGGLRGAGGVEDEDWAVCLCVKEDGRGATSKFCPTAWR
jgi:hypothetical protein